MDYLFQEIFQSKYKRRNWITLLMDIFQNTEFYKSPRQLNLNSEVAKEGFELGNFETVDGALIGIFEVRLKEGIHIEKNRVSLRNLLKSYYRQIDGAFVVFYQNNKWRFSFISEIRVKDENEEWVEAKTEPKRYTYLFGDDEKTLTATQRFRELLNSEKTLDDIKDAFSVEKLSREFFQKYNQYYESFEEYLEESEYKLSVFSGDSKRIRDFVKKLLGRIVFIYFLQKKGWMGVDGNSPKYKDGMKDFLNELFIKSGKEANFYVKWLRKLFFHTLNKERENDSFKMPDGTIVKIPYLNGGLFEDDDIKDYIEFPPAYFEDLFTFFNQYNFTVYEDSPEEQIVAVDPEMLGHIFENLLEDNKEKGAYYTPKEIVHYMCQESLIEYLFTKINFTERQLSPTNGKTQDLFGKNPPSQQSFVSVENLKIISREDIAVFIKNKNLPKSIIENADDIDRYLDDVKICDPAIGSGAFPMGLLNEIFIAKQLLREHLKRKVKQSNVQIKEKIIQNSIYGVDIEKGAVDIARLRFWLSLVVDEEQPRPLPNLDYKIVEGNSLLPIYDGKYLRVSFESKGDDRDKAVYEIIEKQLNEIEEAEKEFFHCKDDKEDKRRYIRNCKIELLINLLSLQRKIDAGKGFSSPGIFDISDKDREKDYKMEMILKAYDEKINSLRELKKSSAQFTFFDWRLDFPKIFNKKIVGDNPGFDIIIGNPPYIKADQPAIAQLRKEILNSEQYESLWEKWDVYVAFLEKGYKLLKNFGILSFIVSDAYMSSKYALKSHKFFLDNASVKRINFCSELKLFDAAVRNIIVEIQKHNNPENIPVRLKHIGSFENFFLLPSGKQFELGDYTFKIETGNKAVGDFSNTMTWGDICYVSYGLRPSSDERYWKGEFKKNELISDHKTERHIKKYVEGKWIKKYSVEKVKYLEWGTRRSPSMLVRPTFPELYAHEKIFFGGMTGAVYDDTGLLCNHSISVSVLWHNLSNVDNLSINNSVRKDFKVKGDKKELTRFRKKLEEQSTLFDLKYLLAILNSKVGMHYLSSVRRSQIGFYPDDLKKLPIKIIPLKEQRSISGIVDNIIAGKKQNRNTEKLEKEIDALVYKLYGLKYEDIKRIECST